MEKNPYRERKSILLVTFEPKTEEYGRYTSNEGLQKLLNEGWVPTHSRSFASVDGREFSVISMILERHPMSTLAET